MSRVGKAAALALICALVVACGETVAPSSVPSPPPSLAASIATPTARPTVAPEVIRKAAATAYVAAAETFNKALKALDKKYVSFGTYARARAYYKADSKLRAVFIGALKLLAVPSDTAGDLHALIAKETAVQALEIEGSAVKTNADLVSVEKALVSAQRAGTAAANLIRSDLGLPPVHN